MFFLVEPDAKPNVQRVLAEQGAEVLDVQVAPKGVRLKVSR